MEASNAVTPEAEAAIRLWAAGRPLVAAIWLYGSRSRRKPKVHREDSDVDLAIEVAAGESLHGLAAIWQEELAELLPYRVHVEVTSPEMREERVWPAVEREGVRLW